jgi:hypothetical protein
MVRVKVSANGYVRGSCGSEGHLDDTRELNEPDKPDHADDRGCARRRGAGEVDAGGALRAVVAGFRISKDHVQCVEGQYGYEVHYKPRT